MIHLIINATVATDNYIESIIIASDRVVSQFMLHILFTFGHIVTISCACERMIWYYDCDSCFLFSFPISSPNISHIPCIYNRIFVCKWAIFFHIFFLFQFLLCGVLVLCVSHDFCCMNENSALAIIWLLWMWMCWRKRMKISFIFADPINLSTEWMKSNGIHLKRLLNYIFDEMLQWRFVRHLQDNQNVSTSKNSTIFAACFTQFWFTIRLMEQMNIRIHIEPNRNANRTNVIKGIIESEHQ